MPELTLNNGVTIPQLGFGVFQVPPEETQKVVEDALEAGYRHIDTAAAYRNEAGVGAAIAASGLPREDLFITTKLRNGEQGEAYDAFQRSRDALGLEVVDLYLIHWPVPSQGLYTQAWKEMEKLYQDKQIRSIGISNFLSDHVDTLLRDADVVPAVNQIELHPTFQQADLANKCRDLSIAVEAYSPLGQGKDLNAEVVALVAAAHETTPAQVILAWHLAQGTIVIPKSADSARMRENLGAADLTLTQSELAAVTALEAGARIGSDPGVAAFTQLKTNQKGNNSMQHTHLGRSGLKVSRLCLGTMNFGPQTDEATAHSIMDSALDSGINFFDTANVYGGTGHRGWTEEIIGRWFAKGGERRERTVLATKLYGTMTDRPNESKLSALNIRRALDASLKRLQTDYIDIYQFHHIDRQTPWDEIWQAIEVAVQQGKILYSGSSNFAGWHIAQAQEAARRRNYTGLVSEQSIYNLFRRELELEVIPAAQHYGLGLIPWSPLQGGLLGGVLKKEEQGVRRAEGRALETLKKHEDQIRQYEDFADELGQKPGDVALAWLLHQPAVTAPIVGPRTQEQLDAAIRALDVTLNEDALKRLDDIFPGHRTAPEDYAW